MTTYNSADAIMRYTLDKIIKDTEMYKVKNKSEKEVLILEGVQVKNYLGNSYRHCIYIRSDVPMTFGDYLQENFEIEMLDKLTAQLLYTKKGASPSVRRGESRPSSSLAPKKS